MPPTSASFAQQDAGSELAAPELNILQLANDFASKLFLLIFR